MHTKTHTQSKYIEITSWIRERVDCGDVFILRSNIYFDKLFDIRHENRNTIIEHLPKDKAFATN